MAVMLWAIASFSFTADNRSYQGELEPIFSNFFRGKSDSK
jgi:hypothetical protein